MSDLIAEWTSMHHELNNISRGRRVDQLHALRKLEATLPGPVELVDGRDVQQYLVGMIHTGYHPHTVVKHLRLIKPFVRWMRQEGMIDADRWLRLDAVHGPRGAYDGKPRPYSQAEIRQFWLELDRRFPWTRDRDPLLRTPAQGEHWVRRWAQERSGWKRVWPYARRLQVEAIAALALLGGLRRNEIFDITIDDMHYQNEYIRVVSRKGAEGKEKVRPVPMNDTIALAVGNWIEFREQILRPDHEHPWLTLWCSDGGPTGSCEVTGQMSHTQFRNLLAHTGRGWEFHRLRHTFATQRYRAGMPLEILQLTLGHATIAQTQVYTEIDVDQIVAASRDTDAAFLKAVQR